MRFFRRILPILALVTGLHQASAAPLLQPGSRIAYNEIVQGTITDSGGEQDWSFTGHAGDLVLVDLRADNAASLDTYLTLMDANGNTLMSDDDSGDSTNSRIGPYALPADGAYTIVAGRYSGSGDYALELKDLRTIPSLVPGKSLVGAVNAVHPNDYFLIDFKADQEGEIWKIDIIDDDPVYDAFMSLYGPGGYITGTESSDDPSSLNPIVPVSGQSYVMAVSWNTSNGGGPYEVKLSPSEMEVLQDGVVQDGTLDYDHYSGLHYFRGEEGDTIQVTAQVEGEISLGMGISSVDYTYSLYSNEGESAQQVTVLVTLPVSTVYVIEIHDGSYMGNSGTYSVQVDWEQ